MKKLWYLVFGLVLLMVLLLPAAVVADGKKTIYVHNSYPGQYDDHEWGFVINQIDHENDAPGFIHIRWDDNSETTQHLSKFTGKVGHYNAPTNSNHKPKFEETWTEIFGSWSGNFNVSHGPCGTPPGPPVPELPAGLLLGLGLAGVGGFVLIRRKQARKA